MHPNQKFQQQYKNKKFGSTKEFDEWLLGATYRTISFKDRGQDLLKIWTDKGGEILHANMQSSVWNGLIVDLAQLKVEKELPIIYPERKVTQYYGFIVETIEEVE